MSESGERPRDARGRFAPLGSGAAARALQNPYSARLAFLPIHARDRR